MNDAVFDLVVYLPVGNIAKYAIFFLNVLFMEHVQTE